MYDYESDIQFHNLTIDETYSTLDTSNKGLNSKEITKRRSLYGTNELQNGPKISIFKLFLDQFKDFMIIILVIAAIISYITSLIEGDASIVDPLIILGIIIFNAILGVVQEIKAMHSLESLKKLSSPYANVLRENILQIIPSKELVPGDIILLETGNYVPADARLIESSNLKVDESALTGESIPVDKHATSTLAPLTSIGDRTNMVYSSSIITYGRGKAIVTATGHHTEVGHIATLIKEDVSPDTPLQKNLAKTSKILGIVALAICFIIFIVGVIQGRPLYSMFMTSVSLAVASIPL